MVRIGTLNDIFSWVINLADPPAEKPPRKAPRKPRLSRQRIDDVTYQVMGMRLRVYAALNFAQIHGHTAISPELNRTLAAQARKLSDMEVATAAERSRLRAGLEFVTRSSIEDIQEIRDILSLLFKNQDRLDRDWIKEMLKDVIALAKVHGTTEQCLELIKQLARCLGCKIRKKRASRKEPQATPEFADHLGYYTLLQAEWTATATNLKAAFRKRALELHPDRRRAPGSARMFQDLKLAYEVLSDPLRRAAYHRGENSP